MTKLRRPPAAPLVALAAAVALLFAGAFIVYYGERADRAQQADVVMTQARILASTVSAALSFDDRKAAQEYVNALRANRELHAVGVYDASNALVASFSQGDPMPPVRSRASGVHFDQNALIVVVPVSNDNEILGTVYLSSVLAPISARLSRYGGIALLVVMASLMVAALGTGQAALTRANRELERRASELAETNSALQTQMEERAKAEEALRQAQKMESLGQLTGGIAHDFNNLLAVILGNLALLRKRGGGDERSVRLIERAIQGAERGAALTQRLLAFSRRQDLSPRSIDVPDLVADMTNLLRRSLGPEVGIATNFPAAVPPVRVDPNQLELALLNLAVNARDAMPGGGNLTISAAPRAVETAGTDGLAPGRYVAIAVSDTGTGMDEATLARATEPFFTTKGVGKGTGLGLSMVHGLAVQSGGALRITSRPGQGTTAEIWLPVGDDIDMEATPARPAVPAPAPAESSGRTILVVDDDLLVAMATADMLEDLGHKAVQASSGPHALRELEGNPAIELVITDQSMPGMTGTQLAAEIRRRWPLMPILLATGHAELPERSQLHLPRLDKPFHQHALEEALKLLLRGIAPQAKRGPGRA
jgi:signal transduction histidine kinase